MSVDIDPYTASAISMISGALAGFATAYLNVRLKIMQLLASILVMLALYSINLRVMGKPNIPLLDRDTVFTPLSTIGISDTWISSVLLVIIVFSVKVILDLFFNTDLGLAMRATGCNPRMAKAQGISSRNMTIAGISLSNAIVALAGALFAQTQGGADISMGIGSIVIGLAAVIIGETLLPSRNLVLVSFSCILGAVAYRFFIAVALSGDYLGLQAQDLNLVTAVIVILALLVPEQSSRWKKWYLNLNIGVKKGASS